MYAPLRKYVRRPDCKVAVLGVGGLGHLAVQFADKMGADVSVIFFVFTMKFFATKCKNSSAASAKKLGRTVGCHCVWLEVGQVRRGASVVRGCLS